MSAYRHEQHQLAVVAVARTHATADLLRATLAAYGYQVTVAASFTAFPSVDFVEGIGIYANHEEADRIRELLNKLPPNDDTAIL